MESAAEPSALSRRLIVVGVAIAALAVAAYFLFGMPGMDHSMGTATSESSTELVALDPDEFMTRVQAPQAFVVDVHVPDAGTVIDGTDAQVPYDRVAGDGRLPADTDTPLLLYCQTGRMSAVAGQALLDAGYTDVAHLQGGTDAWLRAGFPLRDR